LIFISGQGAVPEPILGCQLGVFWAGSWSGPFLVSGVSFLLDYKWGFVCVLVFVCVCTAPFYLLLIHWYTVLLHIWEKIILPFSTDYKSHQGVSEQEGFSSSLRQKSRLKVPLSQFVSQTRSKGASIVHLKGCVVEDTFHWVSKSRAKNCIILLSKKELYPLILLLLLTCTSWRFKVCTSHICFRITQRCTTLYDMSNKWMDPQ
jgi:hypothetical protein